MDVTSQQSRPVSDRKFLLDKYQGRVKRDAVGELKEGPFRERANAMAVSMEKLSINREVPFWDAYGSVYN